MATPIGVNWKAIWADGIWKAVWRPASGGGTPPTTDTLPPGGTGRASLPKRLAARKDAPRGRIVTVRGMRFVVADDE